MPKQSVRSMQLCMPLHVRLLTDRANAIITAEIRNRNATMRVPASAHLSREESIDRRIDLLRSTNRPENSADWHNLVWPDATVTEYYLSLIHI